ncbi:MAG: lipopolysaccharide heptosyltransferase II [Candidatus Electryonea clarkiae]|nr:lipopolysaccharide heptosyltransferase II [Candidatus Electryonea clarkiae]MDP8286847.1 lipopolysaccharide heptosyltransferase II [Candidatus Electryonea clarkiae]
MSTIKKIHPRRILVIQTAFLGDLVLTLPLFHAIKRLWPQARVAALVEDGASGLLRGQGIVDKVITYSKRDNNSISKDMKRIVKDIRSLKCDLALIPHRSFRSGLIAYSAGIPLRVGFSKTPGMIFYTHRIYRNPKQHEFARNLELLKFASADIACKPVSLVIPNSVKRKTESYISTQIPAFKKFVVIAPGSVWATKRWPRQYWIDLLKMFSEDGIRTLIIGGSGDYTLAQDISKEAGDMVFSFAGKLSILESSEVINRAGMLISGDTAPVHLANTVQTPVLSIFGPTVPGYGFAPFNKDDMVIGMDMECRPCAIHGSRDCPLGHHKCMKDLQAKEVYEAALKILNSPIES